LAMRLKVDLRDGLKDVSVVVKQGLAVPRIIRGTIRRESSPRIKHFHSILYKHISLYTRCHGSIRTIHYVARIPICHLQAMPICSYRQRG
jgi:hypothetical protein